MTNFRATIQWAVAFTAVVALLAPTCSLRAQSPGGDDELAPLRKIEDKAEKNYFDFGFRVHATSMTVSPGDATVGDWTQGFETADYSVTGTIEVKAGSALPGEGDFAWYEKDSEPIPVTASIHGYAQQHQQLTGEGLVKAVKKDTTSIKGVASTQFIGSQLSIAVDLKKKTYTLKMMAPKSLYPADVDNPPQGEVITSSETVGAPSLAHARKTETVPLPMLLENCWHAADVLQVADAGLVELLTKGVTRPLPSGKDKKPETITINIPKTRDGDTTKWATVTLLFSLKLNLPDVELEVRCPQYGEWRPTATEESTAPGSGRAYGPGLNFSATLRRTDGSKKAKLPKIVSMEWRLTDTSREPGIAMNFPYKSDDRRPDMEIVASDLTAPEDDTAQAVVIRSPGEASTAVTVFPFDWGGWTTLRVTAKLDDGRTIVGRLKGAPGMTNSLENIPVPASPQGGHIAWSWLRKKCPDWHSDAADEDKFPQGKPGVDGDGFSVYEEYRGFYLYKPKTHYSTEPATKDLFIANDAGFQASAGITQFSKLSKITVRRLFPGDLPRAGANERTVNCNIGAGATNGPQTAIYLNTTRSLERLNDRIPSNSRPGTVPVILVPADYAQLGELSSSLHSDAALRQTDSLYATLDHMVMQALFQTVGVDRPGPSGEVVRRVFVPAAASSDGRPYFTLDGQRVVMERESDGFDFAVAQQKWWDPPLNGAGQSTVRYILIGTRGSAHSGPENCVMRDWFADFYLSHETRDGFPLYRSSVGEKPGTALGATRKGTGINLSTRFPEFRYGDSKVAEPANRQLVVRDNAP